MAAQKKFKFTRHMTPPGILKYTWLENPDNYEGQEKFKTRILFEDNDATRAFCKKLMDTAKKEASEAGVKFNKKFPVNPTFHFPEDADEDDFEIDPETGKAVLDEDYRDRIWCNATSNFKPALYGTVKSPKGGWMELDEDDSIRSGDIARLKVEGFPYAGSSKIGCGVSLRLVSAQLLQKNSMSGAGAGFDDELPEGFGSSEGQTDDDDNGFDDDEIPF